MSTKATERGVDQTPAVPENDIELYMFRHAESWMNADNNKFVGGRSPETKLTLAGIRQAEMLGRAIIRNRLVPDVIYHSPLVRARETARIVLSEMGLNFAISIEHPSLVEMSQGMFEGVLRSEVFTPEVLAEIDKQGKDFALEGGESMNQVGDRLYFEFSQPEFGNLHPKIKKPFRVFAFSHGAAIKSLASKLHGWSQKETYQAEVPNVSSSLFVRDQKGQWRLEYIGKSVEEFEN